MKREGNRLILETRACVFCNGTTQVGDFRPCPRDGMAQRGKPCPHCGTTTKHNHHFQNHGLKPCESCNATGIVAETLTDSLPHELWTGLTFRVLRTNRRQSWVEEQLGILQTPKDNLYHTVWCCTDYGRHINMTDDELIAKVREERFVQACKVVNDDGVFCDYVAIITAVGGYAVVAVAADGTLREADHVR